MVDNTRPSGSGVVNPKFRLISVSSIIIRNRPSLYIHAITTLTLHNDIHSVISGNSMDEVGGCTGVYSCCTPLDVHDHEDPLITDHNSPRTQPLYTGIKVYTIQV